MASISSLGEKFTYEAMNAIWDRYEKGTKPHAYEIIEGSSARHNGIGIIKDTIMNKYHEIWMHYVHVARLVQGKGGGSYVI